MKIAAGKIFLVTFLWCFSLSAIAQNFDNAGDYMDHIGKANQAITEKYLIYLSGMSHGKSARKVEKRRQEVLEMISNTRFDIMGMPPFKGDRTLRDTTVAYLKMLDRVFNEDYGKIVNMEEIAEQSYDAMEAYMLAKARANEKLEDASRRQHEMQKQFAVNHNVNLVDNQSELDAKMKKADEVMGHYNEIYLVFFKPYKQEAYLMDAAAKKNIVSIEQNINSLQKFAEDGLDKLKDMRGYNNDATLIIACRGLMNFYKVEAAKGSVMTDFFLKEENFNKLKKQFESKPASKRTQQDVDEFNKAVNDINSAVNNYNAVNNDLNKQRASALNDWNKAVNNYLDNYMPEQHR